MNRFSRSEETMGSNPPCLTKSNKQHETDPFSIIPLELKTEILLKLRAKDIAKLIFVSKHLSSTVLSKDFMDLFLSQSSRRPQFLFTFRSRTGHSKLFCHSSSQEDVHSDQHIVSITTPHPWFWFSTPVNGLICCQSCTEVFIFNLSTGQFLTLPRMETWRIGVSTFFGYDPVNDLYKVLCMTVKQNVDEICKPPNQLVDSDQEHQVFTLGAQKTWRRIKCNLPHKPYSRFNGICKNGVVYYLAWIDGKVSIVRFDVGSEDFNVIELPITAQPQESYFDLVNYDGKIALVWRKNTRLWVLDDTNKREWSQVPALSPSLTALFGSDQFDFKGTISTGELIFKPRSPSLKSLYILCYDLKKNKTRRVEIGGFADDVTDVKVFLGHIESPMFLPRKLIL